jgi:uncharacterized protein
MTPAILTQSDIDAIVAQYHLEPHSLGGMFAETWRAEQVTSTGRASASSILLLLQPDSHPRWHTVDAEEVWVLSAGADVIISVYDEEGTGEIVKHRLSSNPLGGGQFHVILPAGVWQSAEPVGGAALICCMTSPAFEPDGYRPAPVGWNPPGPSEP